MTEQPNAGWRDLDSKPEILAGRIVPCGYQMAYSEYMINGKPCTHGDSLLDGGIIAIGWGDTLSEAVQSMNRHKQFHEDVWLRKHGVSE